MRSDTKRPLALLALLIVGAGASLLTWFGRSGQTTLQAGPSEASQSARVAATYHLFHVDIAGWYRSTPDEVVVLSPFDLRLSALPDSLPMTLGTWQGEELGSDQEIEDLYAEPDLVTRRRYQGADGRGFWLTAIGSRGAKSFRIFEHTPPICYVSSGWETEGDDAHRVPLQQGALPVRRGVFQAEGVTRVVYYWYQWDGPSRDPTSGVTSWRLTADAASGGAKAGGDDTRDAEAVLTEVVSLLFEETLPWNRF